MNNTEKLYSKCLRCNRPLKTEQAQRRGYGPFCWHLRNKELDKRNRLFDYDETEEERK